MIIVGPDEVRAYRNICKTLNRGGCGHAVCGVYVGGADGGWNLTLVHRYVLTSYTHLRTHTPIDELSTFPINPTYLKPIRVRVGLARRIDSREHKRRKSKKSNDWLIQSAKAMDIELDEDMYPWQLELNLIHQGH